MRITHITAREVLDSRGNPTVEADVFLEDGSMGRASVPSGASTGSHEAHELRDGDSARFGGKGVLKAVTHVKEEICGALKGKDAEDQRAIDEIMTRLDGSENKERLGANAILAVSLAVLKASSMSKKIPLFRRVAELSSLKRAPMLPLPLCNIINGGAHAAFSTDLQEFMILPIGAPNFHEALRSAAEVFHTLREVLRDEGYATTVGDEGGYAPKVMSGNREAFELIARAVEKAGYRLGEDIAFALDVAASELFSESSYSLRAEGRVLTAPEMISWYEDLRREFPLLSIEDGLAEDDWDGWKNMTRALGTNTQLVGDDLLVTNTKFLERAIKEKAGNAILVKVNQIGTFTEAADAVLMAQKADWRAIISHRSGETEDTTIAHIAVGLGVGQIKTGSLSRGERTAKYNELLRIEETLGADALFLGKGALAVGGV